jgi:hypothetical protein
VRESQPVLEYPQRPGKLKRVVVDDLPEQVLLLRLLVGEEGEVVIGVPGLEGELGEVVVPGK